MQALKRQIDSLSDGIMKFKQAADPPAVDAADRKVRSVRTEQTRFAIEGSYERFLVQHLKAAKRDYTDGERTEPLCSCANPYCELKRGRLPPEVFLGESTDEGIRDFMIQHSGDGRVLNEARDQWVEDAGVVIQTLTEALSILKANEPPETDDAENEAEDEAEDDAVDSELDDEPAPSTATTGD
jgi:hypothetical protein